MADHLISTARIFVSDGGASGYGSVPVPTAAQIDNAEAAIAAVQSHSGVDIDSLLTANVTIYLVPDAFFTANGWKAAQDKAWGYTPVAAKEFVSNQLRDDRQRYGILHETFHTIDSAKGVMNHAKRAAAGALMRPAPDQSVTGWWDRGYKAAPNENAADTFPRAYAGMGDVTGGYYTRPIPPSSYAAYRTILGGVSVPAGTTLAAAAVAGVMNIKVASVTGLANGDWILINGVERHQITNVGTAGTGAGSGLTLDLPLTGSYSSGDSVVETGPPSGVSAGDIVIPVTVDTPSGGVVNVDIAGLEFRSTGFVKTRDFDGKVWGPYSEPIPYDLTVRPKQVVVTVTQGTTTPDFNIRLVSDNPNDGIRHHKVTVVQRLPGGTETPKMIVEADDPGTILGYLSQITVPYSGNQGNGDLAFDQEYWALVQATNVDLVEVVSQWIPFTPTRDAGPLITYLGQPVDTSYKIDDLTPTFRVRHFAGTNINKARIHIWNDADTAFIYESPFEEFAATDHRDFTVPPEYLVNGQNPHVSAIVRADGDTDPGIESAHFRFHLNTTPAAPAPVSLRSDDGQVVGPNFDPTSIYNLLGRTDNVWVTTDDQPIVVFPYRDADRDELGYDDDPSRREIELRDRAAEAHQGTSPYIITSGITNEWPVPASVLLAETDYESRGKYKDSAAVESAFSEYLLLRYSEPPTFVNVAPADGDVVTDPTPDFTGDYDSPSGKPKAAHELTLRIAGDEIYRSGFVLTSATTQHVAAADGSPILASDQVLDYEWIVYDSDGLSAKAIGTITTDFTTPDAVTGLTVTADAATDSLLVTWDPSTDPAFSKFIAKVKTTGEQFRRVDHDALTDPSFTAILVRAVGHNVETIVRVTQTNDLLESEPAEASAMLGGERDSADFTHDYWLVRPEAVIQLPSARTTYKGRTKHGQGDTQTDIEVFAPPDRIDPDTGRTEKVLLNWGTGGYEGTIAFSTTDRALIDTLRSWKEQSLPAILKMPYGVIRYVRLISTPDSDEAAWWIDSQLSYIEVSSASADF